MPASIEFLRVTLGLIGVGCAFLLGRSVAIARKGPVKKSTLYGWMVRTGACMVAVAFRHALDAIVVLAWSLGAAALAFGWWNASRPRKDEDLARIIFPDGE
ncbi:MAG: hypothetical protein ABSC23_10860 [Bryobacteraceae bacterium]|jgi:Na+-transporting NADH:ubiquinone oxidoreductase subunit NqrE